jgi:hypothetical protein
VDDGVEGQRGITGRGGYRIDRFSSLRSVSSSATRKIIPGRLSSGIRAARRGDDGDDVDVGRGARVVPYSYMAHSTL